MSTKQEIVIEISPDGKVKMTTHGLKGTDCLDELKPLEQSLGKVTQRKNTSEYYEKSANARAKNTTSSK